MFTIFLTIIFLFMAFYSVAFVTRMEIRMILLVLYLSAIFFVWNPETTTVVANFFGIGRGLDFFLIIFFITILNGMFFIAIRLNSQNKNITKLVRHIAISEEKKQKNK